MAKGIGSAGLIGLTHNVGKRESARQDMATMAAIVQMKKQDELEEQQAILQENAFYDRIRKESEQMLEGDRKEINKRARTLQAEIAQRIKLFGGSRAKFMANGGLGMMSDYQNKLLNSDEVATYKANKVNLERLMELQLKDMGDRILPKDMHSMEEYRKNGRGTITFGGIMHNYDMPDKDTIEFGRTTIPDEILNYKDNFARAMGNFLMEYPEREEELANMSDKDKYNLIRQYFASKNISVTGNRILTGTKYDQEGQGKGTGKDDIPFTQSGEWAYNMEYRVDENGNPIDTRSVKDIQDPRGKSMADHNIRVKGLIGNTPNKYVGKVKPTLGRRIKRNIVDLWTTPGLFGFLTKKFLLNQENMPAELRHDMRNAWRISKGNALSNQDVAAFTHYEFGDLTPDDDGYSYLNVGSGDFLANGVEVTNSSIFSGRKFKVVGGTTGYIVPSAHGGKDAIVVEPIDKYGKRDEERMENLYYTEEGADDAQAVRAPILILEDDEGNTIYRRVRIDGMSSQNNLGISIQHVGGEKANDLSDDQKENIQNIIDEQNRARNIRIERKARIKPSIKLDDPAFQEEGFKLKISQAYNYGGSANRRMNLVKAAHLAWKHFDPDYNISLGIEQNEFEKTFIDRFGFDKQLRNPNITDDEILNGVYRLMPQRSDGRQDTLEANLAWVQAMRNYLEALRTNK